MKDTEWFIPFGANFTDQVNVPNGQKFNIKHKCKAFGQSNNKVKVYLGKVRLHQINAFEHIIYSKEVHIFSKFIYNIFLKKFCRDAKLEAYMFTLRKG